MYLKSVELLGFKTFADKSYVEFGRGVTSIIGPNGCGKSNIVDAIKWAFGDQSAKSLRGAEMTDVIFNGNPRRRSAPFAEVSIVINNEDRSLSVDSTEVSIRRKLFSSGDSEYFLNETQCRLKDIRELFMDTGVGAKTNTVIEQEHLTKLLQASSKERRILIEEAAGVSRFRLRRLESANKLLRVKENIARMEDIVGEVEKQRRSVANQAGRAMRYENLQKEIRRSKIDLATMELHEWMGKRLELDRKKEKLKASQAGLAAGTAELQKALQGLDEQERGLEEEMVRYQTEHESFTRAYAEAEKTITGHGERIESLARELATLEEERVRFSSELEQAKRKMEERNDEETENSRMIELDGQLARLREMNYNLEARIAEQKALFMRQSNREIEKIRQKSIRQNAITREESNLEHEARRLKENREKEAEVEKLLQEMKEKHGADKEPQNVIAVLQSLIGSKDETIARIRPIRERLKSLETQLSRLAAESSGIRSRLETLQEKETAMQGIGGGVRGVLDIYARTAGSEEKHPHGIHGLVADLVNVPGEYSDAMEAALGARMQNLVTSTDEDAKRAIQFLREKRLGRATFLPMDRVRGRHPLDKALLSKPGVIGEAYSLVSFDPAYAQIFSYLLHGVLVMDNLDSALRMGKDARLRIVTLEGDNIFPEGAMSGGSKGGEAGLISRKTEIGAQEALLRGKEKEKASLEREHEKGLTDEEKCRLELQHLENLIGEAGHKAKTHEQQNFVDSKEMIRLSNERTLLQQERERISAKTEEAEKALEEKRRSLTALEVEFAQPGEAAVRPEELARMEQEQHEIEDKVRELELERVQLGERSQTIAVQREHLHGRIADLSERVEQRNRLLGEKGSEKARLDAEYGSAAEVLSRLQGEKDAQQARFFEMKADREKLRGGRQRVQAEIQENTDSGREFDRELTDLAVEDAKLSEKQQQLFIRMDGEFHINIEEQYLGRRKAGDELFLREAEFPQLEEQLRAEIAELDRKIGSLGNINFEAVEELKTLEARESELKSQMGDLQDSYRELENFIGGLEKQCGELFSTTLESINTHFKDMFSRLFGGGSGMLVIEKDSDPMEAGITIQATPPGKSPRVLSQLSGGEKVLTTIAFLFSIFLYKPSPFCILDEIDAPLDEHNVDRFMKAIRGFTNSCQFLIVTHNRRTMSLSDIIQGVTMQENGVSKCMSVDQGSLEFENIVAQVEASLGATAAKG